LIKLIFPVAPAPPWQRALFSHPFNGRGGFSGRFPVSSGLVLPHGADIGNSTAGRSEIGRERVNFRECSPVPALDVKAKARNSKPFRIKPK
jgi:hypothetical protein